MVITADRDILRRLAQRVAEHAHADQMLARRRLWERHNALQNTQPLILCFPEGSWDELVSLTDCQCSTRELQLIELTLRRQLFALEQIADDAPLEPWFDVHWHLQVSDFGVEIPKSHGENRGSYIWDPPLKNLDLDLSRLHPRSFQVDRQATWRRFELIDSLFGDLLPPRIFGRYWWTAGLTQTAAFLVGIEPLMMAMIDQPQAVHRLMAFLRDDMLAFIRWVESQGLLSPGGNVGYVGSGGVGCSTELPQQTGAQPAPATTLRQVWGFAESQETVGISPEMFAEFVMPYQAALLECFGLNCYGCCEQLEHRIAVVMRETPRLRRVSVSPKADQETLARRLAGRYVYSRKADPVPVCVGFNEPAIRADLQRTLAAAQGQPLEIILKDTHTVEHEPQRLRRWVEIARQEIAAARHQIH